ncbi:serine/threonine-protein phosphatase 7 long form homolog isoform X2 [Silene latifolia]
MDPGPLNPELLTLQAGHRSESIWNGVDHGPLKCRVHLKAKDEFYVHPRVRAFIKDTQFYGVHRFCFLYVDPDLITALVERWREETHTFHFPIGEATVTLQDVNVLFGLRVSGKAVTGRSDHHWPALCEELLGLRPSSTELKGLGLKLTWLSGNFSGLPQDADDDRLYKHVRAYILYLIGTIIFPDKSGNEVCILFLPLLANLDEIDEYSWGSAALSCLYRNLCGASKRGKSEISGPIVLLQLWAWERVVVGRPQIVRSHFVENEGEVYPLGSQMVAGKDPLGCKWLRVDRKYKDHRLGLVTYRDMFDKLTETQFTWQPYTQETLQYLPDICHEDEEEWVVEAPLICFEIIEMHIPNRVVRQFGWHQTIPPNCNTEPLLHKTDKRGKTRDYATEYSIYVNEWDNRKEKMLGGGIPYSGFMSHHDPYMVWYREHTRRIVSPQNRILTDKYLHEHHYTPSAADLDTLAGGHSYIYHQVTDYMNNTSLHAMDASYRNLLLDMQNTSLHCLESAHFGHLIQPQNIPHPSPPHATTQVEQITHLTPIQEDENEEGSSSQPRRSKRSRRQVRR